jgi:hypothetical protein
MEQDFRGPSEATKRKASFAIEGGTCFDMNKKPTIGTERAGHGHTVYDATLIIDHSAQNELCSRTWCSYPNAIASD